MKILHLISYSLLILFAACDNFDISDQQSETFIKYYGSELSEKGTKVLTTDVGGFVILAEMLIPGRKKDICLIQTDKYGNTTAPIKNYGGLYDDYAYSIKKTDNGYVIAGSTKAENLGDMDAYVVNINKAGEIIWATVFGRKANDEALDIISNKEGYVVAGYSDSVNVTKRDIMLAKIDTQGKILSFNTTGYSENDEEAVAIEDINNVFLLAGYTKSRPKGTNTSNIYLCRWGGTGSALPYWIEIKAKVAGKDENYNSRVVSLTHSQGNNFIITCNVVSSQNVNSYIRVFEIDADFNILWQKDFNSKEEFSNAGSTHVTGDTIYIVGTSCNDKGVGDIFLLKMGRDGNSPSFNYIGDGTSFVGNDFSLTTDGGYVITGANIYNQNSAIALIKLNTQGEL